MAPLVIDGGTTLQLRLGPAAWHGGDLPDLVADVRGGARTVVLRDPNGAEHPMRCELRRGARAQLTCADAAMSIDWHARVVTVEARAQALWRASWRAWAECFGRLIAWSAARRAPASLGDLTDAGVRVAACEVACDLTGWALERGDEDRWVCGRRTVAAYGSPLASLSVGKRGPDRVSLSCHDKLAACKAKRTPVERYAPAWRAHGWDGTAGVWRIELRGAGQALLLTTDPRSGEVVVDLTDPAALDDPEQLGRWWTHHSAAIRLVAATGERRRRAPTDPRWAFVQSLGVVGPKLARPKRAAEHTPDERFRRERASLLRASARYVAALERLMCEELVEPGDVPAGLADVADELLGGINPVEAERALDDARTRVSRLDACDAIQRENTDSHAEEESAEVGLPAQAAEEVGA